MNKYWLWKSSGGVQGDYERQRPGPVWGHCIADFSWTRTIASLDDDRYSHVVSAKTRVS